MIKQTLEQFKQRPLSWSSISSFEWDKEKWYASYILGIKDSSKELDFGKYVDLKIQQDKTFLPDLPRYEHMQYKMNVMFDGLPLVGIPDGINLTDSKELADYKTGKKAWDQKRADETGQLTFYLLLLYITHKYRPEDFDCYIHWLPTIEEGDFSIQFVKDLRIKTFKTKRTMRDLLTFTAYVRNTYTEMIDFIHSHP